MADRQPEIAHSDFSHRNSSGEDRRNFPLVVLMLMAAAWIPPGLFGHDPWKPDEGYTIGLINHMARTGDWVVPYLTGEPFLEKPPLFYITAALLARWLSPAFLPLPQAAALAAGLYNALTILFCYLAGRERGGRSGGILAGAAILGCVGFVYRAHSSITDTVLWAGFAVACYGMILGERRSLAGAFWFGTGVGMTFMAKGLQGPAFIGAAAAVLPLLVSRYRSRHYVLFLIHSVLFCLPWLLIWPMALYMRSPEYFHVWFWHNNVGRFLGPRFGFPVLAQARGRWQYAKYFPWFTLPLWPPMFLYCHRRGRRLFGDPSASFLLLVVILGLVLLSMAAGQRDLYMIPLLIPMAVLAAMAGTELPLPLDWALRRVPFVFFAVCGGLLWLAWLGWVLGLPFLQGHVDARAPGLGETTDVLSIFLAAVYGGLWYRLFLSRRDYRRHWHWVWAGGVTLVWGTAMLLFMPVLNHSNSYRDTFAAMVKHFPRDGRSYSIGNSRLGESQRAILEYYFGIVTTNTAGESPLDHEYFLVQTRAGQQPPPPSGEWTAVWEGARPGDHKEWYILFRNDAAVSEGAVEPPV